ncbi:MAG: hypothetical protein AB7O62_14355 [Pirellulales bacterium]
MRWTRRGFLGTAAGAGLAGSLADLNAFLPLSPLSAAEAQVTPDLVRLRPEIEPLVRLIEETPRDKCFELLAAQLKAGLPYRNFLAALFLAGIRNVNPQPPGFKFHCVFVIHAANQMSLDARPEERLLPLFWALDDFKASQAKDVSEGDFKLPPAQSAGLSREKAWQEFHAGMEAWDAERADRAIPDLVSQASSHEIIEAFWRYGARDFRNIGHKAIFVANAWRTLQTIGWQHAEPALRSLLLGLLDFGRGKRVNEYDFEGQTYLSNLARVQDTTRVLPGDWLRPAADAAASEQLLATFREAAPHDACSAVYDDLLAGRLTAATAWDAAHLMAGELMLRQPGIYGIHTVTSINGLHYAFRTSSDQQTRVLMLLQAIGWMTQFRHFMAAKPQGLSNTLLTGLSPADLPDSEAAAAESVLEAIGRDAPQAASRALAYGRKYYQSEVLFTAARRLVITKGTDAHDYKYPAAIFEDTDLISPHFRPHMLAVATYHLRGTSQPDSPLIEQARAAIKL